jgi:sigma-54 dependent transcriptional regulator, gfr operon transcriptional activator
MLKDDLLSYLAEKTPLFNVEHDNSMFTATEISAEFDVKRNTVSHYLNILVDEGSVVKINTRPVYFIHRAVFEDAFFPLKNTSFNSINDLFSEAPMKNDLFDQLIGSAGSLRKTIEQIKTSIFYPTNGLPLLISGPTGVGKSFLANLIYQYSIESGILDADAPLINFNCAQYYNNPELLSSNLFGYVKGAFTGADKTKPGMLEVADGGILFLDEVHRLDEEGQEKLFTFMDQGIYKRMGESDTWHKSNVRLIFATTENLSEHFLATFLRRIPIIVTLPGLEDRDSKEKLQFIYQFLIDESKLLKKNITLSLRLVELLANYAYTGNVGELQNTIKYLCATSYMKNRQEDVVNISIKDFPEKILKVASAHSEMKIKQYQEIEVTPDIHLHQLIQEEKPGLELIRYIYQQIYDLFIEMKAKKINQNTFEYEVYNQINAILDKLIFDRNLTDNVVMEYTITSVQDIFRFQSNFHNKFNGNSIFAISYYLYYRDGKEISWNDHYRKQQQLLYQFVISEYHEEYQLSKRLITLIENKLDIRLTLDDEIFLLFYLKSLRINTDIKMPRALILAHGYATASSISNMANRMLKMNIFEAFDMPIDSDVNEIVQNVTGYIEQNDVSKGLVILVDMGSLKDIYNHIMHLIHGPVIIINNVSTQMALYVGDMLQQNLYMEELIDHLQSKNVTEYKIIYPETIKQKLIIITCMTGVGTAVQIQKLIEVSIPESLGIKVIVHDYERLRNKETKQALSQLYNILSIIGTDNPDMEGIPYISLEDLISGKGEGKLERVFKNVLADDMIQFINNNIVRNFSLKRVIDSLTILDTDKVIAQIEKFFEQLEVLTNKRLTNDKKLALYVHVSCLVERLIRQSPIESYPDLKNFETSQKTIISHIKEAAKIIEDVYNVKINLAEIGYIYNILTAKSLDNSDF